MPALFHPPIEVARGNLVRPIQHRTLRHQQLHRCRLIHHLLLISQRSRIRPEVKLSAVVLNNHHAAILRILQQLSIRRRQPRMRRIRPHPQHHHVKSRQPSTHNIGHRQRRRMHPKVFKRSLHFIPSPRKISHPQSRRHLHIHPASRIRRRPIKIPRQNPRISHRLVSLAIFLTRKARHRRHRISGLRHLPRRHGKWNRHLISILRQRKPPPLRCGRPTRRQLQPHRASRRTLHIAPHPRRHHQRLLGQRHHPCRRRYRNRN